MKKSFFTDVCLEILGLSYNDLKRTIPSEDCTDWEEKYAKVFPELMKGQTAIRRHEPTVHLTVRFPGYCNAETGRAIRKLTQKPLYFQLPGKNDNIQLSRNE